MQYEEFVSVYLFNNEPLMRVWNNLNPYDGYEPLFALLTPGQRHLVVLNAFDSEVNNGGVYQFFLNRFDLAAAVKSTMQILGIAQLGQLYGLALEGQLNHSKKLTAVMQRAAEEYATRGPGPISRDAQALREEGRKLLQPWSDPIEHGYLPRWEAVQGAAGQLCPPLRAELASAVISYIRQRPSEFQVLAQ